MDYIIDKYKLSEIDQEFLRVVIDSAFSKRGMRLKEDYFAGIEPTNPDIYLESNLLGGAITYELSGVEYMCKLFSLHNGIGMATMEKILDETGNLAWRSAFDNPNALSKYHKFKIDHDGSSILTPNYKIFLINADPKMAKIIERIPSTFELIGQELLVH